MGLGNGGSTVFLFPLSIRKGLAEWSCEDSTLYLNIYVFSLFSIKRLAEW